MMIKNDEDKQAKDEEQYYSLFGELEVVEDELRPKGLCGLTNMGNTCYMNSAIQSLSNCTPLTQFFLKCDSFIKPNESGKASVALEYSRVMKHIWGLDRPRHVSPVGLARSVRLVHAQFRGYAQQDSQEFLRCLMDRLHFELKRPVMSFESKQGRVHSKRKIIRHERKKLLGGNGSSDVEQPMEIADESESGLHETSNDISENPTKKGKSNAEHHSIITDIFNGKLKSFVQCLACNRVSTTIENFQDLSLAIPGKDDLYRIHSQRSPQTIPYSPNSYAQVFWTALYNWIESWFIGPQISVQDCLSAFFANNELKGDNMYNCEKCNKLRNGVKFLKVLSLPEVLCIHLKRFRHEMYHSSKISNYVSFPVNDLDLKSFLDQEYTSQSTTYDLFAVITHFGSVGGGHYIAYAKNSINSKWYEFNDSRVTEVSEYHVENAEAYVLFYNKRITTEQKFRAHIREEMKRTNNLPSLDGVYICKEWLTRFETCAEPGPISNFDFLCRHGDIPPTITANVKNFVMYIPREIWSSLYSRFEGGPEVRTLNECRTCKKLQERRQVELSTLTKLHEEFQRDTEPVILHCLSISWYKKWNAFTKDEDLEPPGPIDNSDILETNNRIHLLIEDSDYMVISSAMWQFLYSQYCGGPEYKLERKSKPLPASDEAAESGTELT